jgi:hypothetical protein
MRPFFFLLLCGLAPKATVAQLPASTPVYQAYLRDAVFAGDSLAPRPVDCVVLVPLDSGLQRLNFDTAYLRDYLAGQLEGNAVFRELVKPTGGAPLSWLSYPWGLEQVLQRDREAGALLLRLDSALRGPHRLPALGSAGDRVRLDGRARYGFKHGWKRFARRGGWDAFYRRSPRCYGVVELSQVVFSANGQRAVFFAQHFRGSLNGWGGTVFMKLGRNGWEPDLTLQFWIS